MSDLAKQSVEPMLHGSVLMLLQFDVCEGIRLDRLQELIRARTMSSPAEFEIYDLQADPHETRNLYGMPEHVELQKYLMECLEALRSAVPERANASFFGMPPAYE